MRDFSTKVANNNLTPEGRLTAIEDNVRFRELETLVSSSGVTLDPANGPDTDQAMIAQAIARYASGGIHCQDSGAANAYILSGSSGFVMPKSYFDGMQILFSPGNANTGASTVNAFGIGAKAILLANGSALAGAELLSGIHSQLIYSSAANTGAGGFLILPWAKQPLGSGGGGVDTFTGLTDTPGTYAGKAGYDVKVKSDESGLELLASSSAGTAYDALMIYEERPGASSPDALINSWRVRNLNTIVKNEIAGAGLSNKQITLPAGVYEGHASATIHGGGFANTRLYNQTDSLEIARGTSLDSYSGITAPSVMSFKFDLNAPAVLVLQDISLSTNKGTSGEGGHIFSTTHMDANILIMRRA